MNIWHDLNPERVTTEDFIVCIEISKGSKIKYELDKETGMIVMDRILSTSMVYPANYGFIPLTYGDDKDPLDALVLCSESIAPNTLVSCYPIGVIRMIDGGEGDEKIIAIPHKDPVLNGYKSIDDLPKIIFDEMEHFFKTYKQLEKKETQVSPVEHKTAALEIIQTAIDAYQVKFKK